MRWNGCVEEWVGWVVRLLGELGELGKLGKWMSLITWASWWVSWMSLVSSKSRRMSLVNWTGWRMSWVCRISWSISWVSWLYWTIVWKSFICWLNELRYIISYNYDYLRNRSALAVNCWVIIHCLEVSCKGDHITSAKCKWLFYLQLTDNQWIIIQQFTQ